MRQAQIFDGKSFERHVKSVIDTFKGSKSIFDHGIRVNDSAVGQYGSYLEQELTEILPDILKQQYPDKPALTVFDVRNEGALAKVLIRKIKGYEGKHTREHENKENPTKGKITVAYDQTGMRIEEESASSDYKEIDLLRAAAYGDPLDSSLIEAHDESYKTCVDEIAWVGIRDDKNNLIQPGLFNRTDVDTDLSANVTAAWSTATGIQMYNDIQSMFTKIAGKANGIASLLPTHLATSAEVAARLMSTPYAVTANNIVLTPVSVWEMIKQNTTIKTLVATKHAKNLVATNKDMTCLFNPARSNMSLYIPQPLKFSEVFKRGFSYEFESMFRVAGVGINQKFSFAYLKGI